MNYFAQFPQILYTFDANKLEFESVVNIFARVKLLDVILQQDLLYYQYPAQDGDKAWIIADKYYGDPNRHWMVYFANQVVDPYLDMPMSQNDFENNLILAYGSLANAQANLYQVLQYTNVTTTLYGTSNTETYVSTLDAGYNYNFHTKQLELQTLPTISAPILQISNTTVVNPDSSVVTTTVTLVAQSAYDYFDKQNELKRQLNLLDSQYAGTLEQQLSQLLSQ